MTKKSQEIALEYLTSIDQSLHLDENVRQYGELLISELTSQGIQIYFPARTAAACYLTTCRLREIPVRVTKIANISSATKADILNEMQRVANALDLGIPNDDPAVVLEEVCRDLTLSPDIETRAQRVAKLGDEAGVTSGVSPYTYAAAALYIANSAADTDLSQADIAEQFDVSTATLRDRRDDLLEAIGSRLFELQFPTAPPEAVSFVDDLLQHAQTAQWAKNKRHMGILAGAWLYAANKYQIEIDAPELAAMTGVSESTIRARYEDLVNHISTTDRGNIDRSQI